MVEGVHYGPVTPSLWMCHIFSTMEGVHYRLVTLSVQCRVCSVDQLHHHYGHKGALKDYQNCSGGAGGSC